MRRSGVALVVIAALLGAPTAANALAPSSYVVTGTADGTPGTCTASSTPGQDTCTTLRAAVGSANGAGGDPTIRLGAGNYVLGGPGGTSAPLVITTSMAIRGMGAASTQVTQTDGSHEVFALPPGTTTTIADVAIEGGANSGVNNNTTLTLDADLIKGNHVAGIPGSGFTSAGGGIMTFHELTLVRSTVTGNTFYGADGADQVGATAATEASLAQAGGIFSGGTSLLIRESTISGNAAVGGHGGHGTTLPGGAGGPAVGGGIYAIGGTTTIVNSTIAGNVAQGGTPGTSASAASGGVAETSGGGIALDSTGATTLQNDTIADNVASNANDATANAGNVFQYGGVGAPLINDTIIARGHAAGASPARANCDFGLVTALPGSGHNLEDTAAGASGCGLTASAGNLLVAPGASGLAPGLAFNGGLSDTIALQPGSPALAAGGTCLDPASSPPGGPLTIDERGLPRPVAQPCDIGAFQAQPVTLAQGARVSQVGVVLRCAAAFSGESFSTTYTWLRDGVVIPGAAGTTYVSTPFDVGRALRCRASATGPRNSATTESDPLTVQGTPTLTHVGQSAARWTRGRALPHAARRRARTPVGTIFSFTLNEGAQVTMTFTAPGRRVGRRCVGQTTRNRHHRACTLTVGSLTFTLGRGPHHVSFAGRLSRRKRLSPGRYTVAFNATSGALRSRPSRLSFTIVS